MFWVISFVVFSLGVLTGVWLMVWLISRDDFTDLPWEEFDDRID